jgi:hypothetical protein
VVAIHENKDKHGILKERGKICMFVGYLDDTTRDSYRMLNLKTNRVIKSKDILWMKKNYGEWMEPENSLGSNMKRVDEFNGYDWDLLGSLLNVKKIEPKEEEIQETEVEEIPAQGVQDIKMTESEGTESTIEVNQRAAREIRNLQTCYNSIANSLLEKLQERDNLEEEIEFYDAWENGKPPGSQVMEVEEADPRQMEQLNQDIAAMMMDDSEPVTFKQAWDHSDEKKRENREKPSIWNFKI